MRTIPAHIPRFISTIWPKALTLASQLRFVRGQIRSLAFLGRLLIDQGNLPKALTYELKALQLSEQYQMPDETASTLNFMGNLYFVLDDNLKALFYYHKARNASIRYHQMGTERGVTMNMMSPHTALNQLDSARYYGQLAFLVQQGRPGGINPLLYRNFSRIYLKQNNYPLALSYGQEGWHKAVRTEGKRTISDLAFLMATPSIRKWGVSIQAFSMLIKH